MPRPVIGICTALERARWSVWDQQAYLLPRSYVNAVQRAGGLALLLPPDESVQEDPDALATLGIDLDAIRERVERAFGPGALTRRRPCRRGGIGPMVPFTARAKKALELSLREAINLSQRDLRAEHLVLGLLREGDGVAARVLTERGVTLAAAREKVAGRDAA